VNAVAGAWMFITPWVYHQATGTATVAWNAWIIGGLILLIALWALSAPPQQTPEWCNFILGIWLFISPWVVRFNTLTGMAWSAWCVGAVVLVLSASVLSLQGRIASVTHAEQRPR
jgi:hypothetical protein